MIIQEVAPMLDCIAINDGFQYELLLKAGDGQPPITKIRMGPYFFKPDYEPKPLPLGFVTNSPEPGLWRLSPSMSPISTGTPRGWSFLNWQQAVDEPGKPWYLVSKGLLKSGEQGLFKFLSIYRPSGLRIGLEVFRGTDHKDFGVCGPNYEEFLEGGHEG